MPKAPEGLPVITFDFLLRDAGLATVTTLKKHRRQPAPDQEPAGCYWTGHDYVLLYDAELAVDMPAMTPGRQRRYDEARTCADGCGFTSLDPLALGWDKKRYCSKCFRPAMERLWRAERAADRPAITAWARGVLDDPATVLVAKVPQQYWQEIVVQDLSGAVLLDAKVRSSSVDSDWLQERPELFEDSVDPRTIVEQLLALGGRRLVAWTWPLSPLWVEWDECGRGVTRCPSPAEGDFAGGWWDRWVGEPAGHYDFVYQPRLAQQGRPFDAHEQVERLREVLTEMASPGVTNE